MAAVAEVAAVACSTKKEETRGDKCIMKTEHITSQNNGRRVCLCAYETIEFKNSKW